MRRFLAAVLCILLLCTTAYASNALTGASSTATVSQSGSCQMTLTATIRLDEPVSGLVFPLGSNVSGVSLNGGYASTTKDSGITCVKLNHLNNQAGSFPLTVQYTVNAVVTADKDGKQTVTVPLLAGFKYPVEDLHFQITFPTEFDTVPSFFSGYHEQEIEQSIEYTISGATISGTVTEALKDSETLTMTLDAPEGMFPQSRSAGGTLHFDNLLMAVFAGLALVYWLLTMRHLPGFPIRRSTAPEGVSAGIVGSYLVHKPADLTMMVVGWAQLGYLIIHLDENGRVILHKKMEMGNERGSFEQRCFRSLFGKGTMLDATGYRYARLCEKTAMLSRRYASGLRRDSGNPIIFRILACGVGLFAGAAMGDSFASALSWRIIWMILLGAGCTAACWFIQEGVSCLHLRGKTSLYIGLACCAGVILVAHLCGRLNYGLICVGWSLLAGLFGAYGGRRSENGARICTDILGLRRYMKKVSKAELIRILRSNPDYYFELAPYALALGVDKQFARRFENLRQPDCTWLVTDLGPTRTALEWYPALREAVEAMESVGKRSLVEKFLKIR